MQEFIEIDDDPPQKPPCERALWAAVLNTFYEDLTMAVAGVHNASNLLERACALSLLDNTINELLHPCVEVMCDLADVPHEDFVDKLLELVEGVQ